MTVGGVRDPVTGLSAATMRTVFAVSAVVVVGLACGLLTAPLRTRDDVCEPSDPAALMLRMSGILIFVLPLVVLVMAILHVRRGRLPDGWWILGVACGIAFVITLV